MTAVRIGLVIFITLIGALAQTTPRSHLKVGDKAPDFALPNGDGKLVGLAEYTGRGPVVLIFYRGFW